MVQASDYEQEVLQLLSENLPTGASFTDTGTYGQARFSWTPQAGDLTASPYTLTFKVEDAGNGTAVGRSTRSKVSAYE